MEGIIIIAIGIALSYVGFKLQSKVKRIAKNGIQTEGVVFDTVQSSNIESMAKYPIIRFVTLEKEWITETYNISTVPGLLKKGQKITVIYNPDNPKEFFVKSVVTSLAPVFTIAMAIIILSIGACKILHIQL